MKKLPRTILFLLILFIPTSNAHADFKALYGTYPPLSKACYGFSIAIEEGKLHKIPSEETCCDEITYEILTIEEAEIKESFGSYIGKGYLIKVKPEYIPMGENVSYFILVPRDGRFGLTFIPNVPKTLTAEEVIGLNGTFWCVFGG